MALGLIRIDDRLIHGQVVEGWLPVLKAEKVSDPAPTGTPQVKEKKPLPLILQPFEFIISSVVHALFFWKKSEDLEKGVIFKQE